MADLPRSESDKANPPQSTISRKICDEIESSLLHASRNHHQSIRGKLTTGIAPFDHSDFASSVSQACRGNPAGRFLEHEWWMLRALPIHYIDQRLPSAAG